MVTDTQKEPRWIPIEIILCFGIGVFALFFATGTYTYSTTEYVALTSITTYPLRDLSLALFVAASIFFATGLLASAIARLAWELRKKA